MSQADDVRLLKDCLNGSPGAWEALSGRFVPRLRVVCRRALRRAGRPAGDQEAADVVQELFLHLLEDDRRALRAYRGEAPVGAYLAALAVYRVLKSRPQPRTGQAPEREDPAPGPPEILERREMGERLRRTACALPPRERLALALWADGASVKGVGLALGISQDAASRLFLKAKAALREGLGDPR